SRRRHTRSKRDWSSDVCSSDLTDGDGEFDKSTIFLDHLPWPTAVFCYGGGVLVGACPDIIYAKDTNGDGVADEVKTLFSGFGSKIGRASCRGGGWGGGVGGRVE